MRFNGSTQAALRAARKNRLARQVAQVFPKWQAGLVVTKNEYLTYQDMAIQATNSGTTGSTPPDPANFAQSSDGVVTWQRIDTKQLLWLFPWEPLATYETSP